MSLSNEIEYILSHTNVSYNKMRNCVEDVKLLENRIKSQTTEIERLKTKQQWISVEDELPECDINVLVVGRHEYFKEKRIGLACALEYGGWSGYYIGTVTHWMPLPDVPKDEE